MTSNWSYKWNLYESSDDNILDEYSQTQDSMSEQCISKDGKEMWNCHSFIIIKQERLYHIFCGKNLDHPDLLKGYVTIISSLMCAKIYFDAKFYSFKIFIKISNKLFFIIPLFLLLLFWYMGVKKVKSAAEWEICNKYNE